MIRFSMVLLAGVLVCAICASPPAVGSPAPGIVAPLPPDRIPAVLSLPRDYEEDWLLAFDTGHHGFDGEIILLDPTPEKRDFLGSVRGGGSYSAAFALSRARGELYVAESIYDRITSGTRTDYLTVYDTAQLSPQAEIVLPGAKRAMVGPHKGLLRLTGDERFALLFNFTPASSVTVVDVVKRAVVNEVPIPGCALVYPAGPRGFATLCANGALASYALDESGQVLSEQLSRPFNDIEGDVLFMDPAMIEGVAYFPSYRGRVQPVDLQASPAPAVLADWPLTTAQDVRHSWRPTGMQPAAADGKGRLFVLMRRNAREGSSEEPGSQVWIYDVQRKRRIGRIQLKTDGVGIEATRSARGLLAVTTEEDRIDIYEVQSGQRLRSIGDWEVKPGLLEAMAPVAGSAP